jgi:Flp pilus assembly protein TadD
VVRPPSLFAALISALLGLPVVWLSGCAEPPRPDAPSAAAEEAPSFVGRGLCAECHAKSAEAWRGSHHDLAMQPANPSTVLADFNDATFTYYDVTSTFFRRDDDYWVRTDGPDGALREFRVAYTFGIDPIQQFLIEFPGGRYQALNVCWDTRSPANGGQRWFHLYPDEEVLHDDILHWTGPLQNWNYMCAECHSTNLRRNYRPETDSYETTWSEIDVSCEACHGPGSRHVAWARDAARRGSAEASKNNGLVVHLGDVDDAVWSFDMSSPTASRRPARSSQAQVETCGRCHSRRTPVAAGFQYGRPLAESHRVVLLDEWQYHADGQILDEVYVYGSFLQSKMHAAGVTCSDCHDPHGARLWNPGNATCTRCHRGAQSDTPEHHFHKPGSAGGNCVDCHMPAKKYMVVDPRRDHSFRVPRPDLTVKLGTPNACNGCHADQSAAWATATVARWYGPERAETFHYGEALRAGRESLPGAEGLLAAVAADPELPGIARASALSLLGEYLSAGSLETLKTALRDEDPLVRLGALGALDSVEPQLRLQLAYPLLSDAVLSVRVEATRVLAAVPARLLREDQRPVFEAAFDEYRTSQLAIADRAEAHLNLGAIHALRGESAEAERAYRRALELEPRYVATYVNFADLYRELGREQEGEALLRRALQLEADSADLRHALGLLLVRRKRQVEALVELERAAELSPDNPRYAFVFAVALNSAGDSRRALEVLESAHSRRPADRDILFGLAAFNRDAGDLEAAMRWAEKLVELSPTDRGARSLLADLEARSGAS